MHYMRGDSIRAMQCLCLCDFYLFIMDIEGQWRELSTELTLLESGIAIQTSRGIIINFSFFIKDNVLKLTSF